VKICEGIPTSRWKKITENVLNKAEANETLALYYKDHKDEYLCMSCYNSIVVNSSSKFKEHAIEWRIPSKRRRHDNNLTLSESIALLTEILFHREIIEGRPPIFSFSQLKKKIEMQMSD
jgi:hypothetical protein